MVAPLTEEQIRRLLPEMPAEGLTETNYCIQRQDLTTETYEMTIRALSARCSLLTHLFDFSYNNP